jgi:hypothetical protein
MSRSTSQLVPGTNFYLLDSKAGGHGKLVSETEFRMAG